jgi:hypothetical protein
VSAQEPDHPGLGLVDQVVLRRGAQLLRHVLRGARACAGRCEGRGQTVSALRVW